VPRCPRGRLHLFQLTRNFALLVFPSFGSLRRFFGGTGESRAGIPEANRYSLDHLEQISRIGLPVSSKLGLVCDRFFLFDVGDQGRDVNKLERPPVAWPADFYNPDEACFAKLAQEVFCKAYQTLPGGGELFKKSRFDVRFWLHESKQNTDLRELYR
jgi:hypothetical protein